MQMVLKNTISPFEEIVAYETLLVMPNKSLKSITTMLKQHLPSETLKIKSDFFDTPKLRDDVVKFISNKKGFSVSINGDFQYPEQLIDVKYPIQLFYYKGDLGLLDSRRISVVGTRKCSENGVKRTKKIVTMLVKEGFTIISGLALGIDTVAMKTAIENNGNTIGVIGTPIDQYYPKENKKLQDKVASQYLLISHVPFYRYEREHFKLRRVYFPQRNEIMAALSKATVIVEASDTSGTLIQARACLEQGRKLFILNSCFENPDIAWPKRFEERGAIRVRNLDDILNGLKK